MTEAARTVVNFVSHLLGTSVPVGIRAWDGSRAGPHDTPQVVLRSPRALRRVLADPGELGLARAYVSGDLDVDGDLAAGLRHFWVLARQRDGTPVRLGLAERFDALRIAVRLGALGTRPRPPAQEATPRGRRHSRRRDRAAVSHHYDQGNDLYEQILDPTLAYSCADWASDAADYSLADAQHDKLEGICRALGLREGMRLLDVGCGWGSLVLHAARNHGVRAVGVTLSEQQARFARSRAAEAGLEHAVDIRLGDYRELSPDDFPAGPFDAVASVEMGEHVGEQHYPQYTRTLARMLMPTGRLLLQQMSRANAAPGGGAFIERYIAPDMTMRPLSATLAHLQGAGFEVRGVRAMREHYVRTIDAWAHRLEQRWDAVVARHGEEHARMWRLYLTGASLAFEENRMGVDQVLAVRTAADGRSGLPLVDGA